MYVLISTTGVKVLIVHYKKYMFITYVSIYTGYPKKMYTHYNMEY
jgi:hypothetical protein